MLLSYFFDIKCSIFLGMGYGNIMLVHNIMAMNAQNQLKVNTRKSAKSTEKLSSGYKINRSADNAASAAISEKMRKQIRGLSRATENCQDGISLAQVADGALNEVHDILQRLNELAVQSANGTNSNSDRADINKEKTELVNELNRIAYTTTFNDDIYPLLGGDGVEIIGHSKSSFEDVGLLGSNKVGNGTYAGWSPFEEGTQYDDLTLSAYYNSKDYSFFYLGCSYSRVRLTDGEAYLGGVILLLRMT